MKKYAKANWWKFLIVLCVVAVDMLTKFLIVPKNEELWKSKSLIGNLLWLTPAKNYGAGFSILTGKTVLLIVITIVFLIVLFVYDIKSPKKSKLYNIALSLIFAGAIGNLIDRIFFGYVRDFVFLKFINFPVFNVADMSLTFGVAMLLIYVIFFAKKEYEMQSQNINNEQINVAGDKLNGQVESCNESDRRTKSSETESQSKNSENQDLPKDKSKEKLKR